MGNQSLNKIKNNLWGGDKNRKTGYLISQTKQIYQRKQKPVFFLFFFFQFSYCYIKSNTGVNSWTGFIIHGFE